ncbi:flagellar biosynthesis anti-sigma factor FlgM [Thalassotalea agariperforans]
MAININNLNNSSAVNSKVNQNQVKQNNAQQSAPSSQAKVNQDSVSITPQAKQMAELQKKAGNGQAVNEKKVEQLKKAISNGEYKVNPEKLAASIAKFEFDLI